MSKLSRKKENRERTIRNLATSLILHESIQTSRAKAKFLKPTATDLIKNAIKDDLSARRQSKKILFTAKSVKKLFEDINRRLLFPDNPAKNISYYNLKNRLGDNSPVVLVKLQLQSLEKTIQEETSSTDKKN